MPTQPSPSAAVCSLTKSSVTWARHERRGRRWRRRRGRRRRPRPGQAGGAVAPDLLRLGVHALVVGELDRRCRRGRSARRCSRSAAASACGGHARQPSASPRAAISSTSSRLVSSMPMWANGAMIGCGLVPWSRKKLTSTRMNGLSAWSGWPSHAPWPSASSRRSSSSQRREALVPGDRARRCRRTAARCGSSAATAGGSRTTVAHSRVKPSGICGSSPPLVHRMSVLPHGSRKAPLKPLNSSQ